MIKFLVNKLSYFVPMKLITKNFNPILLYHSLGVKSEFENNLDHVNLEVLEQQIKKIQKYWKFVSIDEYVESKNKKGIASITIDDGYKNVIDDFRVVNKFKTSVTLLLIPLHLWKNFLER